MQADLSPSERCSKPSVNVANIQALAGT